MGDKPFQFEFLPNEILLILFQYFDARILFRAFFNLNTRFNDLLQSPNRLSFTISKSNYTSNQRFLSYIHNLTIKDKINIDFTHFANIRCLILMNPTDELIKQLNEDILPYLQHLAIRNMLSLSTDLSDIFNKIFSNDFSHLYSCYLSNRTIITSTQQWMQMSSLRILEVGLIDLFIYRAILSLCPNLYTLKFVAAIETEIPSFRIKPHLNIKRFILKNDCFCQCYDHRLIRTYLSCVPNLDYLCIYRYIFRSNMKNCLVNNDWCASVIGSYLSLLRRFDFYLHVVESGNVDTSNIIHQLVENFESAHSVRYQRCLVIRYSPMLNLFELKIPIFFDGMKY